MFGDELVSCSDGEKIATGDALNGKIVMIYFSAHWCPPCRRFTPALIKFYNQMRNSGSQSNIELVFVSLDREESEYKDYIKDMPWLCTPFDLSDDNKKELTRKYKVSGIPHLVVVDDTDKREIITTDGTSQVSTDPEGENFPWRPKTFSQIWPEMIQTKNGLVESKTIDDKHLMLYFSAHWCPPCRGFTPTLSKAYVDLKAQRDDFELVFVSSDKNQESFDEYYNEMTFWALPFEEREAKSELSKLFGVQGIPSLIMLGPVPKNGGDRPLINDSVRSAIGQGDFTDFPFHPKPYGDLALGADGINDKKCLCILHENGDDEEQNEIIDLVKTIAEEKKESGMMFFYGMQPKGVVPQLRKALKIENKMDDAIMVLLDIPDDGGYYVSDETDITKESAEKFLANPGKRLQLS